MPAEIPVRSMMNGVLFHAESDENLIYVARLLFENNANAIIIIRNSDRSRIFDNTAIFFSFKFQAAKMQFTF